MLVVWLAAWQPWKSLDWPHGDGDGDLDLDTSGAADAPAKRDPDSYLWGVANCPTAAPHCSGLIFAPGGRLLVLRHVDHVTILLVKFANHLEAEIS